MKKRKANALFATVLVVTDVTMVGLAFYLAYHLRLRTEYPPAVNILPFSSYIGMMVIQIVTMLGIFFFSRLYHLKRGTSRLDELSAVFAAVSIGILVSTAITSLIYKNQLDYPRLMVIYAWLLTIVFVSIGRMANHYFQAAMRARGAGTVRVLIVGTGEVGRMVLQKIQHAPGLGYQAVGFVDGPDGPQHILGVPVLGEKEDLPSIIDDYAVDEVIIALPEAPHEEVLTIISLCERGKVSIKVYPDVFQIIARDIGIGDLGGLPLLSVRDIALRGWKLSLKRAMDLIISAIGLVLLSPLMLLTAILIKLESPGPVFYTQERVGMDAKPFWVLKFRSMQKDAEAETGPVWATKDDPRRTRLGSLIRRLSVDELPQLINVLLGEMSLVGPRPERPVFVEQFRRSVPRYMDRQREKAGITGWAQVNGLRGDTSIVERTQYDLWYIENWSLMLDFKILVRTLLRLFSDRNAY